MRLIVTGFALFGLIGGVACGGSEDAPPRQFTDDEPTEATEDESLPPSADSTIDLSYKKGRFTVEIGSDRDYCLGGRTGAIFEKPRKGKAQKVGGFETDEVGVDAVKVKKPGGTYYAELEPSTFSKYGDVSECGGAKSDKVRV